jgi:hypothetical protein
MTEAKIDVKIGKDSDLHTDFDYVRKTHRIAGTRTRPVPRRYAGVRVGHSVFEPRSDKERVGKRLSVLCTATSRVVATALQGGAAPLRAESRAVAGKDSKKCRVRTAGRTCGSCSRRSIKVAYANSDTFGRRVLERGRCAVSPMFTTGDHNRTDSSIDLVSDGQRSGRLFGGVPGVVARRAVPEGSCSVCGVWGLVMSRRGPRMRRSLSIAHTRGPRTGRKSTPFSPTLNLRVGLENRRKEQGGSTHSTLPGGLAERGRKSTPPFARFARDAHYTRATPAWVELNRFNPSRGWSA